MLVSQKVIHTYYCGLVKIPLVLALGVQIIVGRSNLGKNTPLIFACAEHDLGTVHPHKPNH